MDSALKPLMAMCAERLTLRRQYPRHANPSIPIFLRDLMLHHCLGRLLTEEDAINCEAQY